MDRASFEAACRSDGFGEVEERSGKAGFAAKPHTHPFDARILVLAGDFTLAQGEDARTYRAGESFTLAAGCEHVERFGTDGARWLVARRHHGR